MFLRFLRWLARFALLGLALFTAGCVLGEVHWLPELLTHFRAQAAGAGLLVTLACFALRMLPAGVATAALTAVHVVPMLPYLLPAAESANEGAARVRLLQMNVHTANRQHDAVLELVEAERPDLLALLEVNERWLEALSALHTHYPHRIGQPREDNFGIALFSRFPLDDLRLEPLRHDGMHMIAGRFVLGSAPVTLAVAHPVPPAGAQWAELRNQQLLALSHFARERFAEEVILAGDLNITPWSPVYQRLEESSGLRNGAHGLGLFPTWPTGLAPPLRIPIDHFLLSSGLRVVSLETGPEVGSDHLPVLLEVELSRAGARSSAVARAVRSAAAPPRG